MVLPDCLDCTLSKRARCATANYLEPPPPSTTSSPSSHKKRQARDSPAILGRLTKTFAMELCQDFPIFVKHVLQYVVYTWCTCGVHMVYMLERKKMQEGVCIFRNLLNVISVFIINHYLFIRELGLDPSIHFNCPFLNKIQRKRPLSLWYLEKENISTSCPTPESAPSQHLRPEPRSSLHTNSSSGTRGRPK